MSRYVNEQKIKQRSLLEPQTRLLGANIIKPPPLAVVILLLNLFLEPKLIVFFLLFVFVFRHDIFFLL